VRTNGSDGDISCILNTVSNADKAAGKVAAVKGKDFIEIKNRLI